MASLFVSHSSRDAAKTTELVGRVRAEGFEALFVDFDPDSGIPAGRNWERELYSQLRRADGVLYVASPASAASRWCFAELSLARSIGKPVFPILVSGTERLSLLADVQWVDLTSDGEGAYRRLLAGLRRAGLDPADAFAWDPRRSPYPGLEPFSTKDAAVFFGRDAEIDRLLQLLQPTLQYAAGRFVGIVGPSGSGKSSLLRAGLLPRLLRLPERWVVLPALRPGQDPLRSLARSLTQAFAAQDRSISSVDLTTRLQSGPRELVELAGELVEASPGEPKVLVVIDQAEELVTRTGPRDQQRFLGLLRGALSEASPLWAVATLRSEFLSTAPERAGLAEVLDDAVVVEPLSRNRLAEVIARPAQRAGLEFVPGLVERMVEETTGGDALPLLAYTLRELYEHAGPERTIGIADYEAVGGVVGALQRHADQVLDELGRRGEGALVLLTLLKLATVEGEAEPTRRRLRRSALSLDEQAVVGAFVDARLLTSDSEDHEATIEVAHEALLRRWTPLRQAIEDSRASLRLRSELEREAADWNHGGRDESYLLRGVRLAAFDAWAGSHDGELTAMEREFLQASRALASREFDATRRSNRRLRGLAYALASILAIALVAASVAAFQTRAAVRGAAAARREASVARSRQLAAQAVSNVGTHRELALLLAVAALGTRDTAEARGALLTGLDRSKKIPEAKLAGPAGINSVSLAPDGSLIAGDSDGRVVVWDVRGGGRREFTAVRGASVFSVAMSPDGRRVAAGGADGTVRLWDVATGRLLRTSKGHTDYVSDVAFSPDGRTITSASGDHTLRLWDVGTGLLRQVLHLKGGITAIAISPDGRLLAWASSDQSVQLWDLTTTERPLGEAIRTEAKVTDLAFSPTGATLAWVGADGTATLLDVHGRAPSRPLLVYDRPIEDVAVAQDGRTLAVGSADGSVVLWDLGSRWRLGEPLQGHTGTVRSVAFSPGGAIASGGDDKTILLWDVSVGSLRRAACRTARRDLSRAEWDQFMGPEREYTPLCRE